MSSKRPYGGGSGSGSRGSSPQRQRHRGNGASPPGGSLPGGGAPAFASEGEAVLAAGDAAAAVPLLASELSRWRRHNALPDGDTARAAALQQS